MEQALMRNSPTMHWKRILTCAIAFVISAGFPGAATAREDDLVKTIRIVDQALVHIDTGNGFGSGFLIHDNETLVTNRHVVESIGLNGSVKLRPVIVRAGGMSDLGAPIEGSVRYIHPEFDLAIIEVTGDLGPTARPLPMYTDSLLLPRGSSILVHGFPGMMSPTTSQGIVSGHHREFSDGSTYYLLDAAAGSGSSGGPVTDLEGRLVAVASKVYDAPEDLGFKWCYALPSHDVNTIFGDDTGIKNLPSLLSVQELIAEIRNSDQGSDRINSVKRGLQTLMKTRPDLKTFFIDYIEFLNGSRPLIVLQRPSDARDIMQIMLDIGRESARWGVEYSMRGGTFDPELETLIRQADEISKNWGMILIENSFRGKSEDTQIDMVVEMIKPLAQQLRNSTIGLNTICERLEVLYVANEMEFRAADRKRFISDLSQLATVATYLKMGESIEMLGSNPELRKAPERLRNAFNDVSDALASTTQAWESIDPACRSLAEEDMAGDLRMNLMSLGFVLAEEDIYQIEPGRTTVSFEVTRTGRIQNMGILGESTDSVDIDIHLIDPAGNLVDTDEEYDYAPIVGAEIPAIGRWNIILINNHDVTTEVVLQKWLK